MKKEQTELVFSFPVYLNRVWIRGDKEDEAIICTDTRTFVIKEAEVSNTMLLGVPQKAATAGDDNNSMEVDAERDVLLIADSFSSYLDPSASTPKLEKLQFLLNKARYRGPEHETDKADLVI